MLLPGLPRASACAGGVQVHVSAAGTTSPLGSYAHKVLGTDAASAVQNLVTVWSAPNYCYRCGNVAAILQFDENLHRNFLLFNEVPGDLRNLPTRLLSGPGTDTLNVWYVACRIRAVDAAPYCGAVLLLIAATPFHTIPHTSPRCVFDDSWVLFLSWAAGAWRFSD
eukprot:1582783-Rhodomonas_salina.1